MIIFERICLIGIAIVACGLVYEQRHKPATWIIVALAMCFIGVIVWHAAADWLHNFTVAK